MLLGKLDSVDADVGAVQELLGGKDLLADLGDLSKITSDAAKANLADNSRRFCSLFVALENVSDVFHVRPKMHMMQEMLELSPVSDPVKNWTYRDEDFGGSAVQLWKPRGGPRSPCTAGHHVLRKFVARHRVPALQ